MAVSTLVILIITIIVFSSSVYLVWKIFGGTTEVQKDLDRQTKDEIERRLQEGSRVAIPLNSEEIELGQSHAFGLGIKNTLGAPQDFYIYTAFSKAVSPNEDEIDIVDQEYIDTHWLGNFNELGPITIENNAFESVPLRIKADFTIDENTPTPKGTYVFSVCVSRHELNYTTYRCGNQTATANLANNTYYPPSYPPRPSNSNIYKVYVIVN